VLSSLELGYGFVLLCQEENHRLLLGMAHSLLDKLYRVLPCKSYVGLIEMHYNCIVVGNVA